ncbi:MAG: MBL fold metallo-hydrolase [Propionicimonas sp.]
MTAASVTVRMYNVGFGDSFVVTLTQDDRVWRMLVDCGVHWQGQARPIAETVQAIIGDLKAASPDGVPRLDVVAATHHHADHIAGFARDEWEQVEVSQVWLPFVEDGSDPTAVALRTRQELTAHRLLGLMSNHPALGASRGTASFKAAQEFAVNSSRNAEAADRLLGRRGRRFATVPTIRFLPSLTPAENRISVGGRGATVHVLGPSRDPAELKLMDPPANVAWLRLDAGDPEASDLAAVEPLFDDDYIVADPRRLSPDLKRARGSLRFTLDEQLLAASSLLERAVNNTSLFFVLEVFGTRFVFPGDAQHGAWQHVLGDPQGRKLLAGAAFYKVGHHGSHNATPKQFVEEIWRNGGYAMLPYGLVERWKKTIPKPELLAALSAHEHPLVRADQPEAVTPQVTVHEDLWTEISFEVEEDRPPPGFVSDADAPAVPAADTAGATGASPS